jgi:hypothetical protein
MRLHKTLAFIFTLLIVTGVFVSYSVQSVDAGCKCISRGNVNQDDGIWVAFDDGTGLPPGNPIGGCKPNGKGESGNCAETAVSAAQPNACGTCDPLTQAKINLWFRVPTLGDLIGNIIRLMFFIAGLYALVLLLLGGFEWVSSGGEEKKLTSARGKIFNAIIGLVVMVAVLTLVIILEQVVFGGKVCLGISCPINMGDLRIIK